MMQEIFERIDNDNLFFLTILGILAVFILVCLLFAERSLAKREKEGGRLELERKEMEKDDKNEFRKLGIKF